MPCGRRPGSTGGRRPGRTSGSCATLRPTRRCATLRATRSRNAGCLPAWLLSRSGRYMPAVLSPSLDTCPLLGARRTFPPRVQRACLHSGLSLPPSRTVGRKRLQRPIWPFWKPVPNTVEYSIFGRLFWARSPYDIRRIWPIVSSIVHSKP